MDCKFFVRSPKTSDCINYLDPKNPESPGFCKLSSEYFCIRDLHHIIPYLSHSSRMDFIQCRQKYYFRKLMGIYPKKQLSSDPLKLGSIWGMFIASRPNA